LFNEFLREHKAFPNQQRKIEAQAATIAAKQEANSARAQRQIEALIPRSNT
jgi:hypothetical protein